MIIKSIKEQKYIYQKGEVELSETVLKAFEKIRNQGWEPLLIKGHSLSQRLYEGFIGVDRLPEDYTAGIIATNPEHTFENTRFTDILENIAKLVPSHNFKIPINDIDVFVYNENGMLENTYSRGGLQKTG